ncbi:MAG: NAD(P)/FAD-dependent oxidoreductase [Promethearchaeota archaeon]
MSIDTTYYNFHHAIIIGCGPSSLSAAIQLKRANIEFLMIAEEMGGLIRNANLIENLLGFPNGISGKKMVSIMQETIEKFEIPVIYAKVGNVKYDKKQYWITTYHDLGTPPTELTFSCEYLIVGTGTIPNTLEIPGEEEALGRNLLFYDIYKFTGNRDNLRIGIIGSGDAAYDYALNLVIDSNSIEILQRGNKSNALPLLLNRVGEKSNIMVKSNISVRAIKTVDNQLNIELETEHGTVSKNFDLIFVTIGRSPNISLLSPELREKFLESKEGEWLNKKIWFIGDVKNKQHRQLAIAMADGIKAAMEITAMLHK